jgi:lantibiotic modifying enzyme
MAGQAFRDEAEKIGLLLCSMAETEDRVQSVIPTEDLYRGKAGVALFLAYLARAVRAPEISRVADRLMIAPRSALRNGRLKPGGAYAGAGSLVWTLIHMWAVTQVESYLAEALEAVDSLRDKAHSDEPNDVISGSAGLIRVLLEVHRVTSSRKPLSVACLFAEQLARSRVPMAHGCAWLTVATTPRVSFAHGSAGISSSLFHLANATGDDRYAEVAREGLEYERSTWCCEGSDDISASWCEGAGGIAMSRFTLPERFFGAKERREVEIALRQFMTGTRVSDCLCHGQFGDIDLLISASSRLGRHDLRDLALSRTVDSLDRRQACGKWSTPAPRHDREALGLMYGLAGVGYGLLRVADPHTTPSLLSFDPVAQLGKER